MRLVGSIMLTFDQAGLGGAEDELARRRSTRPPPKLTVGPFLAEASTVVGAVAVAVAGGMTIAAAIAVATVVAIAVAIAIARIAERHDDASGEQNQRQGN